MKTYGFTLIVSDVDDVKTEAIYSKCADSSLGKRNGTTYVAFDSEAESLGYVIDSAIADLRSVGVQPLHIEIEIPATV